MAVLPKKKIPDRRHAACVAVAIAGLNVSALLPAEGETIATFTRNPSNPILRGVRIGGETAARSLDAQVIHFIPRNETPAEQLGLVDELVRAKPDAVVLAPFDPRTMTIRKLLALNDLRRDDFRTRFVDGTPERLSCLTAGDCDAVPLGQPQDFVAMRRGFRLLGLSTEAVPEYLCTVTAARRSWADANKDAIVRYVRALSAAFKFIRDPAKRDQLIMTIVDTTGFAEANAKLTLALYFEPDRHVLPKLGEINLGGMEQAIAVMGEGGILKAPLPRAERFVDLQYLQAAGVH